MHLIITLIAIALVFFIIKKSLRQLSTTGQQPTGQNQESMLPCHYCQVHVPASEAIYHGDKTFCQKAHLEAWLKETADKK